MCHRQLSRRRFLRTVVGIAAPAASILAMNAVEATAAALQTSPLKKDDFENGSVGKRLAGYTLQASDGKSLPVYSDRHARPGSRLSALCSFPEGVYASTFIVRLPASSGDHQRVKIAWDMYYDADATSVRNFKPIGIHSSGGSRPGLKCYVAFFSKGGGVLGQDGITGPVRDYTQYFGTESQQIARRWTAFQLDLVQSRVGVASGSAKLTIGRSTVLSRQGNWKTRDDSSRWSHITLGWYVSSERGGSAAVYIDNLTVEAG